MAESKEGQIIKMAISYIWFLSDSRKKAKVKKAEEVMDKIQDVQIIL